jgi:hypothetical protein
MVDRHTLVDHRGLRIWHCRKYRGVDNKNQRILAVQARIYCSGLHDVDLMCRHTYTPSWLDTSSH